MLLASKDGKLIRAAIMRKKSEIYYHFDVIRIIKRMDARCEWILGTGMVPYMAWEFYSRDLRSQTQKSCNLMREVLLEKLAENEKLTKRII